MERPVLIYVLIVFVILAAAILRNYLYRKSRLESTFRFLGGLEITIIALLLTALIFFGCLQIVLRNFFHRGVVWADPLMRHIVLWLGCLGAALATTKMRHINIDIFSRFLPHWLKQVRNRMIFLATAIASSVLGFATLKLVIDERSFGEKAFLNVDIWVLQLILPIAFFLIAYRSLLNLMTVPKERPVDWEDFETADDG